MDSRSLRLSAWLGIVFGIFLVFGETRRNWGDWGHWVSYTFDYLFAPLTAYLRRGMREPL